MSKCFSARGYVGKARRRKEKLDKKKKGRPKISAMSFTRSRSHGRGSVTYRDHFCYLCGRQERRLSHRLCDRCQKWERYNTDPVYREKELERKREYDENHRVENRERARRYKEKKLC
jgi:hypothetical protein